MLEAWEAAAVGLIGRDEVHLGVGSSTGDRSSERRRQHEGLIEVIAGCTRTRVVHLLKGGLR